MAQSPEQLQLQAIGEWGVELTPLELLRSYRNLAARHDDAKLAPVFDGLEQSVRYGMAHSAQTVAIPVAGKTGTAVAAEGAWTHGWFAGYAPAGKPAVAVVVFLEHGHGADAAALAANIFAAYASAKAALPAAGRGR
jgi:cell division protein FtsI/penicillin-binding protein 2